MNNTATVGQFARFGPAPAGFFITPKSLESVPTLQLHPEIFEQLRVLLVAAERELFVPLLEESRPTEFTAQFEFLANRYFPIRLQILINLANAIGVDTLRTEYFQQLPQVVSSLAQNAHSWGLVPAEVAESFDEYFNCAKRIISIAPRLTFAAPEPLLQLLGSITTIDFGFTALGLVFEGTITPHRWAVHEAFKLTRRSLLVYEDAVKSLVASLETVNPDQQNIDFDAAYHAAVLDIANFRAELEEPPASDKRSSFRKYIS